MSGLSKLFSPLLHLFQSGAGCSPVWLLDFDEVIFIRFFIFSAALLPFLGFTAASANTVSAYNRKSSCDQGSLLSNSTFAFFCLVIVAVGKMLVLGSTCGNLLLQSQSNSMCSPSNPPRWESAARHQMCNQDAPPERIFGLIYLIT